MGTIRAWLCRCPHQLGQPNEVVSRGGQRMVQLQHACGVEMGLRRPGNLYDTSTACPRRQGTSAFSASGPFGPQARRSASGSNPAVRTAGPATAALDGVRPMYRARAAAPLEASGHLPYIVLRLATLAPGALRENNEQ